MIFQFVTSFLSSIRTYTDKNEENLSSKNGQNKTPIKEEENFEIEPLNKKESRDNDDQSDAKDSNERRFVQVLHNITLEIKPGSFHNVGRCTSH